MKYTERVRYVLKELKFREVSEGKGVVDYHLIDEFGNNRVVSAMAELNWLKRVSFVKPIHHREVLLIEALAKASLNETIEVDFSEFNKKYPRGSVRSKKVSVHRIKVTKKDSKHITSMGSLVVNKFRLLQLVAVSFAGFVAVLLFVDSV